MSALQNTSTGDPKQVEEEKKDWRKIAKDKRAEREARLSSKWLLDPDSIPSDDVLDVTNLYVEQGWLSKAEMDITKSSMVQVAQYIKEGRYTAVEVVEAFVHRATIAHQLVNP
jgi:amidase